MKCPLIDRRDDLFTIRRSTIHEFRFYRSQRRFSPISRSRTTEFSLERSTILRFRQFRHEQSAKCVLIDRRDYLFSIPNKTINELCVRGS